LIDKNKLKGKYVTFIDKDAKYRTQKVIKINGLMLTVIDAVGTRTRIHPNKYKESNYKVRKYGLKIIGRQKKKEIEEIKW